MAEDKFIYPGKATRNLIILAIAGVVLTIIGVLLLNVGGGEHGGGHEVVESAHHFHWTNKVFAALWHNNVYFVGIALMGVFFTAFNYAAQAGWSAYIKRIPETFGYWIPFGGALTLILFFITNYTAPNHFHIFHWLDSTLYDKNGPNFDEILEGKSAYLNQPFWLVRWAIYFVAWYFLWRLIRKNSIAEDLNGGNEYWYKIRKISAFFLIVLAITSVTASWDWIMSIDPHWHSTLFAWYNFASWFVGGLSAITLVIVYLHDNGYLPELNSSHLHDLGKFVWAFSIFWTYLWFAQFLLIYYANMPEESVYFVERLSSGKYGYLFYANIIINFGFPFLFLMTRDAKRHKIFLKIVCVVLLVGHWIDFYLMIIPSTMKGLAGLDLIDVGVAMIFISGFLGVILKGLTKASLVARNHPMLKESLHHHI